MRVYSKIFLATFLIPTIGLFVLLSFSVYFGYATLPQVIPSFLTAILVSALVWERLYEIVTKRLEYIHERVLSVLYEKTQMESDSGADALCYFLYWDEIQKLADKVKILGSFFYFIKLYPSNAISRLRQVCIYTQEINKKLHELRSFKEKIDVSYNDRTLAHYLGLISLDLSTLDSQDVACTKEFHIQLIERKPKLTQDLCRLERERPILIKNMKKVLRQLEDFMEENALTVPETKKSYF